MKSARRNNDKKHFVSGLIVLVVMILFGAVLIIPEPIFGSVNTETYLLFIIWAILGMIFFHHVIATDHARHFGKAIIVWIALISLELFLGIVWMDQIEASANNRAITALEEYHQGTAPPEILALSEEAYAASLNHQLNTTVLLSTSVVLGLFAVSLAGFISNYFFMKVFEFLSPLAEFVIITVILTFLLLLFPCFSGFPLFVIRGACRRRPARPWVGWPHSCGSGACIRPDRGRWRGARR